LTNPKTSAASTHQSNEGLSMSMDEEDRAYVESLLKRAEAGDNTVAYSLGTYYSCGMGVPEDDLKAREWYKKSAESGNADGIYMYSVLLTNAYYDNSDSRPLHEIEEEVLYCLFTALHLGDNESFSDMCEVFYYRTNKHPAYPDGVFADSYDAGLFAQSLAENNTEANFEFFCGFCYEFGIFVRDKSNDRAVDHFAAAALLGHEKAAKIIEDLGEDGLFFSFEEQKYKRF
jgi:TPR repeat protein